MTPQEEIAGLKTICQAWAKDCKHYLNALKVVRSFAELHIDKSGIFAAIHDFCDEAIKHDIQCDICGDYHEGDVPRECETGDGVWIMD